MAKKPQVKSARSTRAVAPKTRATSTGKKGPSKTRPTKTKAPRSADNTVMGMTVPRTLTNALDSLINSQRGREILASALVAAASAAAAALIKSSGGRQVAKAREVAADAGNQVTKDLSEAAAGVVGEIVSGVARSLLPASLTGENHKTKRQDAER